MTRRLSNMACFMCSYKIIRHRGAIYYKVVQNNHLQHRNIVPIRSYVVHVCIKFAVSVRHICAMFDILITLTKLKTTGNIKM